MKRTITTIILLGIAVLSKAATFESTGATTGWSSTTTWNVVSGVDADNIPDFDDDVTILTGHTVVLSGTSNAKSVTVNMGATFNPNNRYLSLKGNFTSSGTLLNKFLFLFSAATCNITSSTTVNIAYLSVIATTVNVSAGTQITGTNVTLLIRSGGVLNNSGNVSIGNLSTYGTTPVGTWNNLSGSSLTYNNNQDLTVMPNLVSAATSTITLNKSVTSIFPHTFANLILAGNPSTKTASASITVNNDLTINAGVTLDLNSNTLNLAGDLTNSGTITDLADANFNGSTAQLISSSTSLTFDDLTTSNAMGVTFATGPFNVTNSILVTSGTLDVGSEITTLVSDATKTAFIDVANSGGSIAGTLIIQRNIDAQAANAHDLSSPTSNSNLSDWDDELYMSIEEPDDTPGFPGGDGSAGGDTSVFIWNESLIHWEGYTSGTSALTPGVGYNVYIADDLTSFPGRAIDTRGTPNMGDVMVAVTHDASDGGVNEGWNLLGNPFAAHMDWDVVRTANPALLEATNIQTLQSGNYADLAGEIVPPGQGFFAYIVSSGTLTVPSASGTNSTSSSFDRLISKKNYDLKLRLSSNANPYFHEIKVIYNNEATYEFDQGKDLTFLRSPLKEAPSMTFVDANKRYIHNSIPTTNARTVLPLEINAPIDGNYMIDIAGIIGGTEFDKAQIFNRTTGEYYDLSDGNPVSIYLESKSTYSNYSLVLSNTKAINNSNLSADAVSIFATSENINIKGNNYLTNSVSIEVLNLLGQVVMSTKGVIAADNMISLPTEGLNSEVYIVKVISSDNKVYSKKVVVTK